MDSAEKEALQKPAADRPTPTNLASAKPKHLEANTITHDGSTVVVSNPLKGTILLTNQTGAKILGLVDGSRTVEEIQAAFVCRFPDSDHLKLRGHVASFLLDCEKKGIISFSVNSPPTLRVLNSTLAGGINNEAKEREREFHPDVYWYLTFRCNLACTHCSVLSSPHVDITND